MIMPVLTINSFSCLYSNRIFLKFIYYSPCGLGSLSIASLSKLIMFSLYLRFLNLMSFFLFFEFLIKLYAQKVVADISIKCIFKDFNSFNKIWQSLSYHFLLCLYRFRFLELNDFRSKATSPAETITSVILSSILWISQFPFSASPSVIFFLIIDDERASSYFCFEFLDHVNLSGALTNSSELLILDILSFNR